MIGMELVEPPDGPQEGAVGRQIAEIARLAGVLNVTNARLTAVVADVLADESWSGTGIHSPTQWVGYRAGVSPERARDIVAVAERRETHPHVIAAFDAGELSLEQTAVLVKAPVWADADVLDWGRVATVARLRKTIRKEWFTHDPDENDDEPAPADADRLSTSVTDQHRWRIGGELDLGRGHTIDQAMLAAREALFERGKTDISAADCLVEVCERYLDGVESPARRDRTKTWIHLDVTDGAATLTDGWRLPDHVRDHLLCDGAVQPVWERDGVPFSVGRTQRIVPERTRRAIVRRDGGCRVPGCTHDRYVEIHHIRHWLAGGATDTSNLVAICPHHHRLHHQGRLGISGNADDPNGLVFTDGRGRVIEPVGQPVPPEGIPPGPDRPYRPPLMGRVDYQQVGLGWVHPKVLEQRARASRKRPDAA